MSHHGPTYFHASAGPTIGVEAELWLLDRNSHDLVSGAPGILAAFENDIHVKAELLESMIEVNTGICNNTDDVRADLTAKIGEVAKVADDLDLAMASIGTHPFSRWSDAHVTRNRRYQDFLGRMQFPVRRLLICGLHVHIGVESGEKAVAIVNGLLRYIPHFIGLSANSPFWEGQDTGLASTRTKVFEGMPNAGLPPRMTNYSEFQRFMRTLQRANAIESIREVWWDIRPHPGFGTVEIRAFDAVPSIAHMVSLAALSQSLVYALSDFYDNGQQLEVPSEWIVRENKWRATRYGLDADIIVDEEGSQQTLRSAVHDLLDRLDPFAKKLGCRDDLFDLQSVVEAPHYANQRTNGEGHDLTAVVQQAVGELQA